jgi:hypothetical protein
MTDIFVTGKTFELRITKVTDLLIELISEMSSWMITISI